MFRILLLSVFWIISGAYLKISGHQEAEWLLGMGTIVNILAVAGLLSNWSKHRVISEQNH